MTTTLITFVKPTQYANLFLIERINDEHKKTLNIKRFQDKDWLYIKDTQITPKNMKLVANRTYELTDVNMWIWNECIMKKFTLSQTFESLNYKRCLFS